MGNVVLESSRYPMKKRLKLCEGINLTDSEVQSCKARECKLLCDNRLM